MAGFDSTSPVDNGTLSPSSYLSPSIPSNIQHTHTLTYFPLKALLVVLPDELSQKGCSCCFCCWTGCQGQRGGIHYIAHVQRPLPSLIDCMCHHPFFDLILETASCLLRLFLSLPPRSRIATVRLRDATVKGVVHHHHHHHPLTTPHHRWIEMLRWIPFSLNFKYFEWFANRTALSATLCTPLLYAIVLHALLLI